MNAAAPFVHLHVHSDYSLLDGACDVGKLVARAAALGQPAVALTDHGNLFGAVAFQRAAKAAGIQPILGCELYVAKQVDHRVGPGGEAADAGGAGAGGPSAYNHLIVLCENETGYGNLVKIVSEASLHGFYYKPRISKAFLAEHSGGLIALSACLKGEVQEWLTAGKPEAAEAAAAAAGFHRLEMGATLTGAPLYRRAGYTDVERLEIPIGGGLTLPVIVMAKDLPAAAGAGVATAGKK